MKHRRDQNLKIWKILSFSLLNKLGKHVLISSVLHSCSFNSSISSHNLLYAFRRPQEAPSTSCLDISSAKYPTSPFYPPKTIKTIQPCFLTLFINGLPFLHCPTVYSSFLSETTTEWTLMSIFLSTFCS